MMSGRRARASIIMRPCAHASHAPVASKMDGVSRSAPPFRPRQRAGRTGRPYGNSLKQNRRKRLRVRTAVRRPLEEALGDLHAARRKGEEEEAASVDVEPASKEEAIGAGLGDGGNRAGSRARLAERAE